MTPTQAPATTDSADPADRPDPAADASAEGWSPTSWRQKPEAQQVAYPDPDALDRAAGRLAQLPPLVTSWEIERLKHEIAQAQRGERFCVQGGDCAEVLAECRPEPIANKLKILLQMSLVLVHGLRKPVTRIGRFAGQYAKPRSSPTESGTVDAGPQQGQTAELPSYFGDLVNRPGFNPQDRAPDPELLIRGYESAAMTLNFIRSLLDGGFADLHHPENWNLRFMRHAHLSEDRRAQYDAMARTLAAGVEIMQSLGEAPIHELTRVEFFTSHEGLNLIYESAQTRRVPRRPGWYDLTTHLPWIGERTRQLDGAHVEFFRGIQNPVGLKVGPKADPNEIIRVVDVLNPKAEPGKIVLIPRMGAKNVETGLPPLLQAIARSGRKVMWSCDPMHGNGIKTESGIKTRDFDDIRHEIEVTADAHNAVGTVLGGVHFELTGEDVTECIGGVGGPGEADLTRNYVSLCDPRLNYEQAMELAFVVAAKLAR